MRLIVLFALTVAACAPRRPPAPPTAATTLITNARLIDGSGGAARSGGVRIAGDRIAEVGTLRARPGERVIDAGGLALAPGFIDTHSHHDRGLFDMRDAVAAVSQGITTMTIVIDGISRRFRRYWARGAVAPYINDDGTIAPTAAGGSIPFAPDITMRALVAMRERYGDDLYTRYGFLDAFNPTLKASGVRLLRGRIIAGKGWFDDNYIGIDQGPIVAMSENHRSGLLWTLMKRSPYIVRGLCRAGFTGGWIEGRCN